MAKIVWDRTDDIRSAKKTIPFREMKSREDFRPPSTIETDFTRLLAHNVPHVNWTFELIHDWYYCRTMTPAMLAEMSEYELSEMYKVGTRYFRCHLTEDEIEDEDKCTCGCHEEPDGSLTCYYKLNEDGTFERTDEYAPVYIRAQQTAIDWKSKIGNSDMSSNFKTDYTQTVEKGDYVVREDGMLYMLNWNITSHANNQATQSVECNAVVDIMRKFPPVVDEKGFIIIEGGWRPVAARLPISHSEYAGRPDYSGASMQAGMHPDHLISVYCQWNATTRKIRLDDEFVIGDFKYRVINISLAEVQIDRDYGVLTINAKRVAGGSVNGDEYEV